MAKTPRGALRHRAATCAYALNDYLAGRPVNVGGGFTSAETAVMGGVVAPMAAADGTAVRCPPAWARAA